MHGGMDFQDSTHTISEPSGSLMIRLILASSQRASGEEHLLQPTLRSKQPVASQPPFFFFSARPSIHPSKNSGPWKRHSAMDFLALVASFNRAPEDFSGTFKHNWTTRSDGFPGVFRPCSISISPLFVTDSVSCATRETPAEPHSPSQLPAQGSARGHRKDRSRRGYACIWNHDVRRNVFCNGMPRVYQENHRRS